MSKQIAVMMSSINMGNQKKILEGMIDAAKETDSNLFVFTCHIKYDEKEENKEGAYHIMTLPDFRCFDGAVIVRNTIQHEQTAKDVFAALRDSGIPAVSIDSDLPGMDYLGVPNYEAQYEIVEHLITEHGCRDICYVAGPSFTVEARERRRGYEDALKKYGIPLREENVEEGVWEDADGRMAVERFLKRRGCPEAIVCANDMMASGVLAALRERGLRVPEDVRVTGFDDDEMAELLAPSLTTVDKNQHMAGREALLSLFDRSKEAGKRRTIVPYRPVYRASCGCRGGEGMDMDCLKAQHISGKLRSQMHTSSLKNMITDFTGMEKPEELVEALKTYVLQMGIKTFYLCMCEREKIFGTPLQNLGGEVDLDQVNADYTDKMSIPLAYEDGEFRSYGAFPKGMVLPEECRTRSGGNYYIVFPIHYQKHCFGYCVSGNSRYPLEEVLHYLWMVNIGIGLENIRRWMLLRAANVRLNRVWAYDSLTNLYNRAGFKYAAAPMLDALRECGAKAFLVFMDLDGLKVVNDTLGHEMGDQMIETMADILQESIEEDEVAMRYGGDEFVIIGEQRGRRMEELIDRIHAKMDAWNRTGREFTMSASIGGTCFAAEKIEELDVRIEEADKRMYQEKKEKKRKNRGENK